MNRSRLSQDYLADIPKVKPRLELLLATVKREEVDPQI
jgi:hypothetical protein